MSAAALHSERVPLDLSKVDLSVLDERTPFELGEGGWLQIFEVSPTSRSGIRRENYRPYETLLAVDGIGPYAVVRRYKSKEEAEREFPDLMEKFKRGEYTLHVHDTGTGRGTVRPYVFLK